VACNYSILYQPEGILSEISLIFSFKTNEIIGDIKITHSHLYMHIFIGRKLFSLIEIILKVRLQPY